MYLKGLIQGGHRETVTVNSQGRRKTQLTNPAWLESIVPLRFSTPAFRETLHPPHWTINIYISRTDGGERERERERERGGG